MRTAILLVLSSLLLGSTIGRATEEVSSPAGEAMMAPMGPEALERAQQISEDARASVAEGRWDVGTFTNRLQEDGIPLNARTLPVVLQALHGLALQPGTEVALYEEWVDAREASVAALLRGEENVSGVMDTLVGVLVDGGLLTEEEAVNLREQLSEEAGPSVEEAFSVVAVGPDGDWRTREGNIVLFRGEPRILQTFLGQASEQVLVVSPDELASLLEEGPSLSERLADRRERANRLLLEAEKREEIPTHGSLGQTITSWMFLGGHDEVN